MHCMPLFQYVGRLVLLSTLYLMHAILYTKLYLMYDYFTIVKRRCCLCEFLFYQNFV